MKTNCYGRNLTYLHVHSDEKYLQLGYLTVKTIFIFCSFSNEVYRYIIILYLFHSMCQPRVYKNNCSLVSM